jgi:hypothetical protein
MAKKIREPIPYAKAERNPRQVPNSRLDQIEAAALAAGKTLAAAQPKSRLDELASQAQRAIRSGQREADDATDDEE